ncbi:MAG: hypothetical protein DWQ01_13880 [Planctomycetota bacterium]|nr:MAG: hypothetical protein DWQ01_13880 [Planctomycetota bacterium]
MTKKRTKVEEVKPEMTPMIDVTFLLLIFFIVTLKFKVLEGRLDAALPKDRGTGTSTVEEIEKVDIIMQVLREGQMVPDPATRTTSYPEGKLKHYVNRVVSLEVGNQRFTDVEKLRDFLKPFDKDETPVSIDAREGIVYGDVVKVLDVVVAEQFKQVAFAGSHENE